MLIILPLVFEKSWQLNFGWNRSKVTIQRSLNAAIVASRSFHQRLSVISKITTLVATGWSKINLVKKDGFYFFFLGLSLNTHFVQTGEKRIMTRQLCPKQRTTSWKHLRGRKAHHSLGGNQRLRFRRLLNIKIKLTFPQLFKPMKKNRSFRMTTRTMIWWMMSKYITPAWRKPTPSVK